MAFRKIVIKRSSDGESVDITLRIKRQRTVFRPGEEPEHTVIREKIDIATANHDEHGWAGMAAVEVAVINFAEALGIKVEEKVTTLKRRMVPEYGIELPYRIERRKSFAEYPPGEAVDLSNRETIVDEGTVWIPLRLLEDLSEQNRYDSDSGSAFIVANPHQEAVLIAHNLAVKETRGGLHSTGTDLPQLLEDLHEQYRVLTAPDTHKVQYYDSSWGGWRGIDTYGDHKNDFRSRSAAQAKARKLSASFSEALANIRFRAISVVDGKVKITVYSRGRAVR